MAFDPFLAERIRSYLTRRHIPFTEKRMMGALAIMVDDKMLCAVAQSKADGLPRLMARVGSDVADAHLEHEQVVPWDMSKRRMKDYLLIGLLGLDSDVDLHAWVDRCLSFNPQAKRSKGR